MNEWLSTLVPALGQVLLDFLWQGALIGLVAAVLLHVLRDARAQLRYAVACLAMLACAVVPLLGLAWSLGQGGAMDEAASANASRFTGSLMPMLTAASDGIAAWRLEDALPAIVAAWACGACIFSLRMAMGVWWIQRLCAAPQPSMQQAWQARLDAELGPLGRDADAETLLGCIPEGRRAGLRSGKPTDAGVGERQIWHRFGTPVA